MKFLQALAITSLFSVSYACLKLDGTYNRKTRDIGGTITDNGQKICTFSGKLHDGNNFGSCIAGFSAFIDGTLTWGSYSNHGREGTFRVAIDAGRRENEVSLVAQAFGC